MAPKIDTSKLPYSNMSSSSSAGVGVTTCSMSNLTNKQGLQNLHGQTPIVGSIPSKDDSNVQPTVQGDMASIINENLADPAFSTNSKSCNQARDSSSSNGSTPTSPRRNLHSNYHMHDDSTYTYTPVMMTTSSNMDEQVASLAKTLVGFAKYIES
ncbi:hypothetical protein LIER_29312 [Lithospermum erythrorhizon]|uniref:Uncharacterized protein n=1 Tax=Lithospermum erythrorhizon TaxID=34254 RepID=A0AAV3RMA7_LITER